MKLAKDVLQSRKSLATKTDLHARQATLIKWIVGAGIALFAALQFFDRVP